MRPIHQDIFKVVDAALAAGYRHIDTAVAYNNHQSLARALAVLLPEHNLTRQDIFITSKIPVWNQDPSWPSLADCHRGLQVTQPLQFCSVTYEPCCRQYLLSFKQNTWIFS